MHLYIVVIRDRAADAFGQPTFVLNLGSAIRSFGDAVNANNSQDMISQHPEDFDLYHLGSYDDHHAKFEILDSPVQIAIGKDLKKPMPRA